MKRMKEMKRENRRMSHNALTGTWRLVSAEYKSMEGEAAYPYGQDPVGYIIYSDDGYMSVAIMKKARMNYASGDRMRGTLEEKSSAADSYLSYCGRYEIQGNKVIHHIEVSLFPNSVDTDQERTFEIDGDRLSLSTPSFLLDGKLRSGCLIWKRV